MTRSLDPHLKPGAAWSQSQDLVFAGAAAFVVGKAKSVLGIQVVNGSTLCIVLAQPFANRPSLLVLSEAVFASQSGQNPTQTIQALSWDHLLKDLP